MTDADFTRAAAEMVAENDRVPRQREADSRPIERAGTVIEVDGSDGQRMRFVSNGHVWIACVGGADIYRGIAPEDMNRRYAWRIVVAIMTVSVGGE